LKQVSATRGYESNTFTDLPASREEVLAAESAVHEWGNTLLIGSSATEAAFKRARLANYRIIHLAVHGFSNNTYPDRAALLFLSDPAASRRRRRHCNPFQSFPSRRRQDGDFNTVGDR